jgi:hypothetical protein
MPSYEWRCTNPKVHHRMVFTMSISEYEEQFEGMAALCRECQYPLVRIFSFAPKRMMHEHFNLSSGTVVSDHKQFRDDLKRASERATLRTGIPHDYQPVDLGEKEALGVTEEGL